MVFGEVPSRGRQMPRASCRCASPRTMTWELWEKTTKRWTLGENLGENHKEVDSRDSGLDTKSGRRMVLVLERPLLTEDPVGQASPSLGQMGDL